MIVNEYARSSPQLSNTTQRLKYGLNTETLLLIRLVRIADIDLFINFISIKQSNYNIL